MWKAGGTGRPAPARRASEAPLPPTRSSVATGLSSSRISDSSCGELIARPPVLSPRQLRRVARCDCLRPRPHRAREQAGHHQTRGMPHAPSHHNLFHVLSLDVMSHPCMLPRERAENRVRDRCLTFLSQNQQPPKGFIPISAAVSFAVRLVVSSRAREVDGAGEAGAGGPAGVLEGDGKCPRVPALLEDGKPLIRRPARQRHQPA